MYSTDVSVLALHMTQIQWQATTTRVTTSAPPPLTLSASFDAPTVDFSVVCLRCMDEIMPSSIVPLPTMYWISTVLATCPILCAKNKRKQHTHACGHVLHTQKNTQHNNFVFLLSASPGRENVVVQHNIPST